MATLRRGEDGYQDGYEETKAKIEYLDRLAREGKDLPADPTTHPRYRECRRCRQSGYVGEYPFSTAPSTGLCDDCL